MAANHKIKREIKLNVPPDRAYQLITDPELITQWFCDVCETPDDGMMTVKWRLPECVFVGMDVKITEAEPGKAFSYVEQAEHGTTTRFKIEATDVGSTLSLVEELPGDMPNLAASIKEHEDGWHFFFNKLQSLA